MPPVTNFFLLASDGWAFSLATTCGLRNVDPCGSKACRKIFIFTVFAKRCAIEDLVPVRTKLLKWSTFGPHFTQKAVWSFLLSKNSSKFGG